MSVLDAVRPSRARASRPPRRGGSRRTTLLVASFLAPAVVAVLVLRLWPSLQAAWDSVHSTPLGVLDPEFVGLEQFKALFDDPGYLNTLKVTAVFGVVVNPLQVLSALLIAVLLNERLRGAGLARTLVFLPVAVPPSVSAVIWATAFRPDGTANGVLAMFGVGPQPWLTSPQTALWSIIIVVSWIGVGYWTVFLIAGLKEISPSLYEAAALDGANRFQRFIYITIPQLKRQIAFVLVADTISNLLVFAPVQILTQGGPQGSTDLIMNDVFERAFISGDTGSAGAATVVLVALALVIVGVQFKMLGTKEDS
jgi:multiple sugar transport system permease protein